MKKNLFLAAVMLGVSLFLTALAFAPTGNQDMVRGAQLYDKWYAVLGEQPPAGDMPLWSRQSDNTRSGPETWRCVECHGWDYQGAMGSYGSGSHYTGFPSVLAAVQSLNMDDIIGHLQGQKDPGHDFSAYLSEPDMLALAAFLKGGLIDDEIYIDSVTLRVRGGNFEHGEQLYESVCINCHGEYGNRLVIRSDGADQYLGSIANHDPWRFLHRTRFGVAGTDMPIGFDLGWTASDGRDILLYAQSLPSSLEELEQVPASSVAHPSQLIGGPAVNLWTGILTGVGAFLGTIGGSLLFIAVLLGVGILVVGLLRRRR